jgi:hypothetical protein
VQGGKTGGSRLHAENTRTFEKEGTNLKDIQKDAVSRNLLEYYEKEEFPTVKK